MTELRIFGPPGTGKTTYLASQIRRSVERYGGDNVFVSSFTRAAAAEIAGRGLPIPPHMVGTLHAHCFRALGHPELTEAHIKEWNEGVPYEHALRTNGAADLDDAIEMTYGSEADEIAARYHTYRAMIRPRELWESDVRYFADRWEAWKKDNLYLDFTDLIEIATEEVNAAPNDPSIGFFDEVQDFTPLELRLVRRWGERMDFTVLAGDDDQCLYGFKGATSDAFLDPPLPLSQKRTLSQSYRVPSNIHSIAERWVTGLSRREPKVYLPRDFEGEVRHLTASSEYGSLAPNFERPDRLLEDAQRYLDEGKKVMFLGACSYMLDPLKQQLRSMALPFHNPYRRKNGGWNPLFASKGTHSAERLFAWMKLGSGEWTPNDVKLWSASTSKPRVFKKGGAEILEALPMQHRPIPGNVQDRIFTSEFLYGLGTNWIDYFERLLLDSKRKSYEFPLAVLRARGDEALMAEPKIVIGTIHSVKGGEADVVYLMPDLSRAGYSEYLGVNRDATVRQMYVGMTRARETLIITGNAGQFSVQEMM